MKKKPQVTFNGCINISVCVCKHNGHVNRCALSCFYVFSRCDSISKLQGRLEYLRSMLDDPVHFKNIYRYAYDFARVWYITRI